MLSFTPASHPASSLLVDLSWPNCSINQNLTFELGIVGINGGLDFKQNPCLIKETLLMQRYIVYINTGYPGMARGRKYQQYPLHCYRTNATCLAYNYGYNATLYAIRYANLSNVHSSFWWLDVETDNSWTSTAKVNRSSIAGAAAAIKQTSPFAKVGIYSSPNQWNLLTNNWTNYLPVWTATGNYTEQSAVLACQTASFTRGPRFLTQYTQIVDINYVCSKDFYGPALNYFL